MCLRLPGSRKLLSSVVGVCTVHRSRVLINFVDDMIDNYIQVGIVRAVNTVLMVCAMAFGIVIAMRLLTVEDVVIDKKFSELSMVLLMTVIWCMPLRRR